MITVSDLDTYLHSPAIGLDAAVPVLPGTLLGVAGYPDRAVFVTSTPGGGLQLENATDVQNFQFRFRGGQGDPTSRYTDAESLAKTVDTAIINAAYPTTIGGRQVIRLWRTGGPPAYLAAESQRAHFTCGYLFEAAAG